MRVVRVGVHRRWRLALLCRRRVGASLNASAPHTHPSTSTRRASTVAETASDMDTLSVMAGIPDVWKKESAEGAAYDLHQKELQDAYRTIKAVYGVSAALAHKLVYQDGIRTLDQLRQRGNLTTAQRIGLQYYDALKTKIPRPEMDALAAVVREAVTAVDPNLFMQVCGSYRRGAAATGDLDVLISHPEFTFARKEAGETMGIIANVVSNLKRRGFVLDKLSQGTLKYIGVCRLSPDHLPRQVDLKLFPWESVPTGLLHLTGSGEHNRQMRDLAIRRGYKLSEYGLYYMRGCNGRPTGFVSVTSEQDIFDVLGVPYIPPEHRSI
jgi:DNA polymerase/3'-5' exonuclease PolX